MTASQRDRTPIDQIWLQYYCDEFLKIATQMGDGAMKDAVLRRVECVMDVLEAWQLRNVPIDQLGHVDGGN